MEKIVQSSSGAFISYRRDPSWSLANKVYQALTANRIPVFMDIENMEAGKFDEQILRQIAIHPYFLVVLQPNSLDRCTRKKDWFRREIEEATHHQRIIIPLYSSNFSFQDVESYLPDHLAKELLHFQGVELHQGYFEAAMEKLIGYLKPISNNNLTYPLQTPYAELKIPTVVEAIVPDTLQSVPIASQRQTAIRLAKRAFNRAILRPESDIEGKFLDINEAIQLNSNEPEYYALRATIFQQIGEYKDAIDDITRSIDLIANAESDEAIPSSLYSTRASIYYLLDELELAIKDYTEAIGSCNEGKSVMSDYYRKRGQMYFEKGDKFSAIFDFTKCIELEPENARHYRERAKVYSAINKLYEARDDETKARELD